MRGRLAQAAHRFDGVMRRRMRRMADLVANDMAVSEAGANMGLTKGQTSRVWNNIKAELGTQAR